MDFFCTCGRGTELFAVAEISYLFREALDKISFRDGKVFFTVSGQNELDTIVRGLLHLKSIERLFVAVLHSPNLQLFSLKQATWKLKSELQRVDLTRWESCLELWKNIRSADEKTKQPSYSTHPEVRNIVNGEKPQAEDDSAENESIQNSSVHLENKPIKRKREDLTFRVSAKCSGAVASWFSSQSLSRLIGCEIARRNSWTPELRQPTLEICVQLNRDGLTVGLPCTCLPLSSRPYLRNPGLRTTVSSIMASLAALRPGMVLLDPMCGQGTILIEAAKMYSNVLCIGCDNDGQKCPLALDNVHKSNESGRILMLQADVSNVPLMSESVDVVVCDIPFGLKHAVAPDVGKVYRTMLGSMDRLLKPLGRVVLLCGANLKDCLLTTVESLFSSDRHSRVPSCEGDASVNPDSSQASLSSKERPECLSACESSTTDNRHHSNGFTLDNRHYSNGFKLDNRCSEFHRGSADDGPDDQDYKSQTGSDQNERNNFSRYPGTTDRCTDGRRILNKTDNLITLPAGFRDGLTLRDKSTLDSIVRLTGRVADTVPGCPELTSRCSENRSVWVTEFVHYLKLGDTHSYLCVFSTERRHRLGSDNCQPLITINS